jgi:hypothetical protein
MDVYQIGKLALPVVLGLVTLGSLAVFASIGMAAYALAYTLRHNRIPPLIRANHLIEARMHYHYGRNKRNYRTARRDGQDNLGNSPDPLA